MKLKTLCLAAVTALGAPAAFAAGDPTDFGLPTGYVQYGDAQSYALQVSCTVIGAVGTGCPYYVASSPGNIAELTVNGTGPSGGPVTTNFVGMDNAYALPNSPNNPSIAQLNEWFVRTGGQTIGSGSTEVTFGSTDPGQIANFVGDQPNTWDTTLAALKTFLTDTTGNVGAPVIFFNNNQTNSGDAANQTLAAWAQVWITDGGGNVVGVWDFSNNNGLYAPVPFGGGNIMGDVTAYTSGGVGKGSDGTTDGPIVNPANQHTDYVLSGGQVCLNSANTIVPCDGSGGAVAKTVNNNLGANQAAYAIIFPEMNQVLAGLFAGDLTGYSLHADIRLGCDPAWYGSDPTATTTIETQCMAKRLTNGYEQIFMGRMDGVPTLIPEPGSLLLSGLGLLGVAVSLRRRKAA